LFFLDLGRCAMASDAPARDEVHNLRVERKYVVREVRKPVYGAVVCWRVVVSIRVC